MIEPNPSEGRPGDGIEPIGRGILRLLLSINGMRQLAAPKPAPTKLAEPGFIHR
jgi:hypothetical protein